MRSHESAESEADAVVRRYARRAPGDLYSMLRPEVWQAFHERQRAMIGLLRRHAPGALNRLRVLEIGCGSGSNLIELIRLGFDPANLVGNELLPDRVALARHNLPAAIGMHAGDACALPFEPASFDIVYQSTVFTSLLDDAFQQQLAAHMWAWVRPGGGILWYDFVFDNPRNPDVRGVPLSRIRALFPGALIDSRRVTLAPPISRAVVKIHPAAYRWFNALPLLRSHVLCWIEKKA
ncbi:MAG TPA: class I SAM-dependent methyltransferase [Rhodocyclaceae bacterium]|nr:class I SAM-dependent methyltransferase [Rhodocyclaceae bacterium]